MITFNGLSGGVQQASALRLNIDRRLIKVPEAHGGIETLSMAQRAALRSVEETAARLEADAYARLTADLQTCGCAREMFEEATRSIRAHARVAVHFHPDRFGLKPITVAEALLSHRGRPPRFLFFADQLGAWQREIGKRVGRPRFLKERYHPGQSTHITRKSVKSMRTSPVTIGGRAYGYSVASALIEGSRG